MRRRPDKLIPLEAEILSAAIDLQARGEEEFYGFAIAKEVRDRKDARLLTAHGTLYRALGRLEKMGFLNSRWEDAAVAAEQDRLRRKYYRITASGVTALSNLATSDNSIKPAYGGALG